MSFVDFGFVKAHLQPYVGQIAYNTWKFKFFEIFMPKLYVTSPNDTISGFIGKHSENDYTFGDFLFEVTREKEFPTGTYFKLQMMPITKDLFDEEIKDIDYNMEPVLIDPDYMNNTPCFQICFNGNVEQFKDAGIKMPSILFKIQACKPYIPYDGYSFPYGTPLFGMMQPEDIEEFFNTFFFNQILVLKFAFVRGSSDAAGYDILINEMLNNSRDFDCAAEYNEALIDHVTVQAKYSLDLVFPKFYRHTGEQCHHPSNFMLRSRFSRSGFQISAAYVNEENSSDLKLTLTNFNKFPIRLSLVKDENAFPLRMIQFVPNCEITTQLQTIKESNDRAEFLGVPLIENEVARKSKV